MTNGVSVNGRAKVALFFHHLFASYTVITLLIILLNLAQGGISEDKVIYPEAFLRIFIFCAVFALANLLYTVRELSHALRLLIHFCLTVGGVFVVLYLPNNTSAASSGKLMMLLILVVLYWLVMGAYLAIFAALRSKRQGKDKPVYQSIYKK